MATTGVFTGTILTAYVGGVEIGGTTQHTFSLSVATSDATTKDSSGNEEVIASVRSGEISFDGFVSYDATYGWDELFLLYQNRTKVVLKFSTEVSGDPRYSFNGFLTSLEKGAPNEETVTFSGTFQKTGAITLTTVT